MRVHGGEVAAGPAWPASRPGSRTRNSGGSGAGSVRGGAAGPRAQGRGRRPGFGRPGSYGRSPRPGRAPSCPWDGHAAEGVVRVTLDPAHDRGAAPEGDDGDARRSPHQSNTATTSDRPPVAPRDPAAGGAHHQEQDAPCPGTSGRRCGGRGRAGRSSTGVPGSTVVRSSAHEAPTSARATGGTGVGGSMAKRPARAVARRWS